MNGTDRLALILAALPIVLLLAAALAALRRDTQRAALLLPPLAALSALALLLLPAVTRAPFHDVEASLFAWSPLGLYGVSTVLHASQTAALLNLPLLLLASLGTWAWWRRGTTVAIARELRLRFERRLPDGLPIALALLALAAAEWALAAGDLISLFLAVALYLLGGCGVLWSSAGAAPAGRRLLVSNVGGLGLLACVLVLAKVNGHVEIGRLSTSGFAGATFAGLLLSAAVVAPAPPFQGWLLRVARSPLAPALGFAGAAVAMTLLLTATRVTAAQFYPAWQWWLGLVGWATALAGLSIALVRTRPAVRFAAIFAGRIGIAFSAAAVATPSAMVAALLYFSLTLPCLGLLWLAAAQPRTSQPATALEPSLRRRRPPPYRRSEFWIWALVLATAAGLPATIGGTVKATLVGALTAWPNGDQLLRLPLLALDAATLIVGAGPVWSDGPLTETRAAARRALLVLLALVLVVPALLPPTLLTQWFGPIGAQAVGAGSVPPALDFSRRPSLLSAALGAVVLWALVQRMRGREWLPGPARALLGTAALAWYGLRREWRRRGLGTRPVMAGEALWRRLEGAAAGLTMVLRPLEERYYAVAAVMIAVAVLYIIGR